MNESFGPHKSSILLGSSFFSSSNSNCFNFHYKKSSNFSPFWRRKQNENNSLNQSYLFFRNFSSEKGRTSSQIQGQKSNPTPRPSSFPLAILITTFNIILAYTLTKYEAKYDPEFKNLKKDVIYPIIRFFRLPIPSAYEEVIEHLKEQQRKKREQIEQMNESLKQQENKTTKEEEKKIPK